MGPMPNHVSEHIVARGVYIPVEGVTYCKGGGGACSSHEWGRDLCTHRACISRAAWPIVFECVAWGHYNCVLSTSHGYWVHLHVRTCAPLFHISWTTGRIMLKFGVWFGTQCFLCKSCLGYLCTCTRAHPIFVSQEPIDQWCLNLMHG